MWRKANVFLTKKKERKHVWKILFTTLNTRRHSWEDQISVVNDAGPEGYLVSF